MSHKRVLDYERFLSESSKRRKASAIRSLYPLLSIPGMISLGGGMPNSDTFPLEEINLKLKKGDHISLVGKEISEALQYSPTPGLPGLLDWIRKLQIYEHEPITSSPSWDSVITTGSQEGLSKSLCMLLNEDDTVLLESPTYSSVLSILKPMNCNTVSIDTDDEGLIPEKLDIILSNWKPEQGNFPKVLYTIPTGGNPSGVTIPNHRRSKIYEICCRHDLLILEDDPYYYLQYDENEKLKSFFSLDVEGRVIRLDSFSKIVSAGLRIGVITAPAPLLTRIQYHMQAETLHTSALSQAILLAILNHWGLKGFHEHVKFIQQFYRSRRDSLVRSANKHLKGLAEWTIPTAGMFLWLKLLGIEDTSSLIKEKATEKKVLFMPGSSFFPDDRKSSFVRAAFSVASPEQMDEAIRRLAELITETKKND